jgi:hypothetical protein
MNTGKRAIFSLVVVVSISLSACRSGEVPAISPSTATLVPINAATTTLAPPATATPTRTSTPTPMPTATATPTRTPMIIPTPVPGTMYYDWLEVNSGIAIYAGNIVLCSNDYICPEEKVGTNYGESFDLGRWDPGNTNSQFIFAGQTGAATDSISDVRIMFPEGKAFTDVVILARFVGIDHIEGILPDGRLIPFNYTINESGELVFGSNFIETWRPGAGIHYASNQGHIIDGVINKYLEPCGIVGFEPDSSYATIEDGAFLFRLPTASVDMLGDIPDLWGKRGNDPFLLVGIHIVFTSLNNVPQEKICH